MEKREGEMNEDLRTHITELETQLAEMQRKITELSEACQYWKETSQYWQTEAFNAEAIAAGRGLHT